MWANMNTRWKARSLAQGDYWLELDPNRNHLNQPELNSKKVLMAVDGSWRASEGKAG